MKRSRRCSTSRLQRLAGGIDTDREKRGGAAGQGYGFYASGALESLTKLTYDEIVEQEIGFIGTPEKL